MGRRKNHIENANMTLSVKFEECGHKLNESFTLHKTSVLGYQQVANNFKFSKPCIDAKLYQLDMLPIMCAFDEDGQPTTHKPEQMAYGAVIPNSARWEMASNGEEYLFVDTVLWNGRFSELDNIGLANQSIEIDGIVGKYNQSERYYEVNDFNFSCLTILHENVNPAFKEARIDNEEFSDTFEKFKQEFSEVLKSIDLTKYEKEGGVQVDNEKTIEADEVVEVEMEEEKDTTTDQVEDKDVDNEKDTETDEMAKDDEDDKAKCQEDVKFELSYDQIRDCLSNKLDNHYEDGSRKYDIYIQEVYGDYCIYTNWYDSCKYYKCFYSIINNEVMVGDSIQVYAKFLTQAELDILEAEKAENINKFETLSIKYAELESEISPLREFKLEKEEEEKKATEEAELAKKNELVNSFSDKLTKDEISSVVTDIAIQTYEEIKAGLSIAFADKVLGETKEETTFANIDNNNKTVSVKDKLLAELQARKNKL